VHACRIVTTVFDRPWLRSKSFGTYAVYDASEGVIYLDMRCV
jgi:hypothetical protein